MGSLLVLLAAVAFGDGQKLYLENCASCHGKEGAGDGLLAKDLRFKPRAFIEGKFAVGNTADAMVKTVMSGIPGEDVARMPPFKNALTEPEIREVVDYVRTLMPAQPELTAADMKMDVTDRAKVIRGILAPLREGEKPLPRGLLAGLPSGFSFEYANDESFHLVAVRRGDFALRSDWEGRGGKPLTPLGAPEWIAYPDSENWTPFAIEDGQDASGRPSFSRTRARLRETVVDADGVQFGFDLIDPEGRLRARVVERPREVVVAGGAGVVQEFTLRAQESPVTVLCSVRLHSDPTLGLPALPDAPPIGDTALARHTNEQGRLMGESGWWVIRQPGGGHVCVKIDAQGGRVRGSNFDDRDCVDIEVTVGREPVALRRTMIFRKDATLEALRAMARELQ